MRNSTNAVYSIRQKETLPDNNISLQARLGLVKELTMALVDELKTLEYTDKNRSEEGFDFNAEVRRFEIDLICRALRRTAGHQTRAARLLGIKLTTLHDKIRRYNIDPRNLEASRDN
jgi:DNA-binding NtrC family response regulator